MSIHDNVLRIEERINNSVGRIGKRREDIKLLSVTKTVSAERINELYKLGYKEYGENRIQEYRDKHLLLPDDCEWHIIGRLQKNKLKYVVGDVALIHSLADISVAEEAQRLLNIRDKYQSFLIEVNVSKESSKDGIFVDQIEDFIENIQRYDKIRIKGLMTIGVLDESIEQNRAYFSKLKKVFDKLSVYKNDNFEMRYLSMGMSSDFDAAIEEGANIVRIGSAIFGDRVY